MGNDFGMVSCATVDAYALERLVALLRYFAPHQCSLLQRKMLFDFDRINIKLGPWKFGFPLKAGQLGTKYAAAHQEQMHTMTSAA